MWNRVAVTIRVMSTSNADLGYGYRATGGFATDMFLCGIGLRLGLWLGPMWIRARARRVPMWNMVT